MDAIDIELLIAEVQKRPQIYDPSLKEYHDKNVKKNLWNQICQMVYPSVWNKLSSTEKTKYGKELQKKWGSLRRGFRRELTLQKATPSGSTTKKRKKYIYFDCLLFLAPFTTLEDNESSVEEGNSTEEQNVSSFKTEKAPERSAPKKDKQQSRNSESYDEEILKVLKERNELLSIKNHSQKATNKIDDDDEAFLKSLLPSIKQFKADEKLLLRIELMKTILNFKKSSSNSSIRSMPSYQSQNFANIGYGRNYASDNESHIEEYIPRSVLMISRTRRHSNSSTYTPSSSHQPVHHTYNSAYNSSPVHSTYNMPSPVRETYDTPSPVRDQYNASSPVRYTYGASKYPVATETDTQDSLLSLS